MKYRCFVICDKKNPSFPPYKSSQRAIYSNNGAEFALLYSISSLLFRPLLSPSRLVQRRTRSARPILCGFTIRTIY